MTDAKTYTFLNPEPLARTVILWLYIDLGISLLSGAAALVNINESVAAGLGASKDTPLPSDLWVGAAGLAQLAVAVVVGFLILKWIYRVSRNAHATVAGLTVPPPWAVGWYFVPIASLWKPFQAMRETWQVSSRPEDWRTVPVPVAMRWWWGLYLLGNALGQASLRIYLRSETLGGVATSAGFDMASAAVSVPLDLIFIGIVRELTRKQVVDMTFGNAEGPNAQLTPVGGTV